MDEITILLTGEYWHPDFADVIAKSTCPVTLRKLDSVLSDTRQERRYQVIAIAQSRPNQFDKAKIEQLASRFANLPVVLLCGSWCEGEQRSGDPIAGLLRVYWHQWKGRFQNFAEQLKSQGVGSWNLPRISNAADHIEYERQIPIRLDMNCQIGISSFVQEGFEMLNDALECRRAQWIEAIDSHDICNFHFDVICVEANSLTEFTQQRIRDIQMNFPRTPLVLLLNFPRRFEFEMAQKLGIHEIVSKPFQLADLKLALSRVLESKAA